jgi:LysM repeat protein
MSTLSMQKQVGIWLLVFVLVAGGFLATTVSASAATSAQSTAQESIYIVRSGDTLTSIARQFGTTVQAIMTANNLTSTRILVGQRLVIPTPQQQPSTYQVQRGDTLYSIARRFGTTVQAIMTANNLTSTRIVVGQQLVIPGATQQPTRYQVQRGDTLYSLARRFNTTVQAIMTANSLTSARIIVGQWLTIPRPQQAIRYQVQRGDTLYSLARRFGSTIEAIMAANHLTSTRIVTGQWLTIPA